MTHPLVLYMAIAQRQDLLIEAAGTRLAREARAANRTRKPGLVTSAIGQLRTLVGSRTAAPAAPATL